MYLKDRKEFHCIVKEVTYKHQCSEEELEDCRKKVCELNKNYIGKIVIASTDPSISGKVVSLEPKYSGVIIVEQVVSNTAMLLMLMSK